MKVKKMLACALPSAGIFASLPAFAAQSNGLCALIGEMQSVFNTLRVLAFVGAAFILASWAWDFIKGGADGKGTNVMETLKGKGISMLVGFALLFSIGIGLSFLMNGNMIGCATELTRGW